MLAGVLLLDASVLAQQPVDTPVFRSRVDLITLDVSAVDNEGRPVADLGPGEFTVKVDGKSRRVVSAQFIRVDGGVASAGASLTEAAVTTNTAVRPERRIMIAVDQSLIRPAALTPLLTTASAFVGRLRPEDFAGFVAFPEPGPRAGFTTDKARVREAMKGLVGNPRITHGRPLDMSLTEAITIDEKEKAFVTLQPGASYETVWPMLGPAFRRVLERGCNGLTIDDLRQDAAAFERCVRDAQAQAIQTQNEARVDQRISLQALERVLAGMAQIEGHKSMVLFSAGLLAEDPTLVDEVIRLAAAARTSITVIAVDRQRDEQDITKSSTLEDRSLELAGLDLIAERTGGRLVRASGGTGQGIFDRIERETSAWYSVAVEREKNDRDRQRLEVSVRRKGVSVRSNRMAVASAALLAARPPADRLREALGSGVPVQNLPVRIATFARRDPSTTGYRLHLAAEVGALRNATGEFSFGYTIVNATGQVVGGSVGRLQLVENPADKTERPHFETVLALDPGRYALRLGAVDAQGRLGVAVRAFDLPADTSQGLTSDLVVGDGPLLLPLVDPVVRSGRLGAYVELYPPESGADDLRVSLEIAASESTPALTSADLTVGGGGRPAWKTASGVIDVALEPGRYVARTTVRRGDQVVRVLARPFTLERTTRSLSASRGTPISDELRLQMTTYVGSLISSLAQIVAQEEFSLEDPSRRVTSDFLLVPYPGSPQDLLSFRDVIRVNGKDLPNREARLEQLFVQPWSAVIERARQIREASEAHVPSVFNPIYVLAFLQPGTHSRFQIVVKDADDAWPANVREVTLFEIVRPTLIRGGRRGTDDAPVEATVWIEEGTGRVLRGDMRIGTGRSAITTSTTFRTDARLQIAVPAEMRTRNPDGEATYSNLRRFSVQTDEVIEKDVR